MALIGLILATVINIFMASNMITYIISFLGVVIFAALTAYDVQKIKQLKMKLGDEKGASRKKLATLGALILYMDLINTFLFLLPISGRIK